jgi:hypothetical protein
MHSPVRLMTTWSLPPRSTVSTLSSLMVLSILAFCLSWAVRRVAAPPMWNVRRVSWVPGSPMDCAAMTPTASPMFTGRPVARFRP